MGQPGKCPECGARNWHKLPVGGGHNWGCKSCESVYPASISDGADFNRMLWWFFLWGPLCASLVIFMACDQPWNVRKKESERLQKERFEIDYQLNINAGVSSVDATLLSMDWERSERRAQNVCIPFMWETEPFRSRYMELCKRRADVVSKLKELGVTP